MNDSAKVLQSSALHGPVTPGAEPNPASGLEAAQIFCGLVATAGYAGAYAFGRAALRIDMWVFWLLVSKPLIDLSWNWNLGEVLQQEVNLQTLVALLGLCLGLAAIVQSREKLIRSKLVSSFLAWALLAVVITPTGWGINELIRLYSGAVFFFTAGHFLDTPEKLKRLTRFFLIALLVPVVLTYFQAAGILPFSYWDWADGREVGRASGMYQTPLGLVRFLIFGVPLALWLRDRATKASFDRILSIGFLLLTAPALFFTLHRAGWIIVGLEVLLWLTFTHKAGKVMIFAAALLVFGLAFSQRVESLYTPLTRAMQGEFDVGDQEFLRGRGALWVIFLDSLFSSRTAIWFIGKGGSTAVGFVPSLADGTTNEPHNDFIRILHAYGIVGLGIYLLILARFFRVARVLRRRARGCFDHDLGTILLIVLIAIGLLSITTEPMRYPACAWYLFTLASICFLRAGDNSNLTDDFSELSAGRA